MKPTNVGEYVHQLNVPGQAMYRQLNDLIRLANPDVCETLFVSNPYYYLKDYEHLKPHHRPSIMLFFFKDHVNVFAHAIKRYVPQLGMHKVTEKHTLQIDYRSPLADSVLIGLLRDSLRLPVD